MGLDMDLQSIQEVRDRIGRAKKAQEQLAQMSQEQLDAICEEITESCMKNARELAELAARETGFGCAEDKVLKNQLGSRITWESIKNMKTVGILREDTEKKVWEIGVPVGVVAALIPSTNPTSTVMYKSLISIKAGNAIVVSPHPGAKGCIEKTCQIIREAAERAGAPEGTIECITLATPQATETLLKHPDVGMILATGGEAMVHAAYSSGNPALGVGPGNGPSYIEHTADIRLAIKRIIASKTFDNGTICASEQSIVTEACIAGQVEEELERQGGYFLSPEESDRLGAFLLRANGTMNPQIVGKTALRIGEMAGLKIPEGTRVLISRQDPQKVGRKNPYSREKLCPVLGYYVADGWEDACELCIRILKNEGAGHTMTLHTRNEAVVREFALKKPVSRILVNTPGALGGVGATTGLAPALTLGCGAVGGSATSDNITPMHLINIRRVAYGLLELEDLRSEEQNSERAGELASEKCEMEFSKQDVEAITRAVLERLKTRGVR